MTKSESEQEIKNLAHKMIAEYGQDSGLFVSALSACMVAKMAEIKLSKRREMFDRSVQIMSKAIDILDEEDRRK